LPAAFPSRSVARLKPSPAASSSRVAVGVLGATGYAGVELLRLLARHPAVELAYLSSEQYRDRRAADVYPFLAGIVDATLQAPDPSAVAASAEVVFTALPHGAAAPVVRDLVRRGVRVLDLSADFRLRIPPFTPAGTHHTPRPSSSRSLSTGCPSSTATGCATRVSSPARAAIPRARSSVWSPSPARASSARQSSSTRSRARPGRGAPPGSSSSSRK
jgi:hypothetical protein